MMTRPASLTDLSHSGPSESGSLLAAVALAMRQGFLIARCLQSRPSDVLPTALRHPVSTRALRLMRSDD
jgi:hypothetical protein